MRLLKLSTAYDLMIFMADSSDHVTGKTGLTLTITASKQGGNFSGISPTVTERANGWYEVALTSSHTDTLGDLCLHITGTAADPTDVAAQVIAVDFADAVRGGMTALPNAAANASGGLAILDGNGDIVAGITGDVLGRIIGGGSTAFSAAGVWAVNGAAEDALATANSLSNVNSAIGGFSGSGNNTILGVLKAIASKAAATPSDIGGTFDPATDSLEGQVDVGVNVARFGTTTVTGRDIGLSVLISSGTGTGQLDVTSGRIKADTVYFGGSAGSFTTGVPAVNTTLIAGSLVSTSSAQIGVNVVNAGGTAWGSGAITAASIANGAIDAATFAAGAINAAAIATGAIDADALAADAGTELADAILSRNVSNVEGSAGEHTLCTVVLAMLENSISGTTLTIKRTDGSTTHYTKTLSVDAAADPITGIQ